MRSLSTAIKADGVVASERKWAYGSQNHICVHTSKPTAAGVLT